MKKFLLLFVVLLLSVKGRPATCTASQTGNWNAGSSWSCGRTPGCGDSLIIPAGITITVSEQTDLTSCGSPLKINIYGTLTFASGKKLLLPCQSEIFIQDGGQITSAGGVGLPTRLKFAVLRCGRRGKDLLPDLCIFHRTM